MGKNILMLNGWTTNNLNAYSIRYSLKKYIKQNTLMYSLMRKTTIVVESYIVMKRTYAYRLIRQAHSPLTPFHPIFYH